MSTPSPSRESGRLQRSGAPESIAEVASSLIALSLLAVLSGVSATSAIGATNSMTSLNTHYNAPVTLNYPNHNLQFNQFKSRADQQRYHPEWLNPPVKPKAPSPKR
jgi:hypothetical protein